MKKKKISEKKHFSHTNVHRKRGVLCIGVSGKTATLNARFLLKTYYTPPNYTSIGEL